MGGKLDGIEILTVNRDTICSIVGEDYPPNVETWSRDKGVIRTNVNTPRPTANLVCLDNKIITQVDFASYGDPVGSCGHFLLGKCNAQISQKIVEQVKTAYFFPFFLSHTQVCYICLYIFTCNFLILNVQYCLGKKKCTVPVDKNIFDKHGNTCPGSSKTLAIQAHCGRKNVRVRESHSS